MDAIFGSRGDISEKKIKKHVKVQCSAQKSVRGTPSFEKFSKKEVFLGCFLATSEYCDLVFDGVEEQHVDRFGQKI